MLKLIINCRVLIPQGWLEGGSVIIDGNKILAVSNSDLHIVDAEIIDAKGCYVVPGGVRCTYMAVAVATLWKAAKRLSVWPSRRT